jgi:TolB-like protein/Flp pilus assembly protein TadD
VASSAGEQTVRIARVEPAHATSSAKYIITGIKRHKRVAALTLAALAVAVAAATYFYSLRSGRETINSIAVMPFINVSGDPNTEYLSEGISESVNYSLSHLPNLKVMASTTVFRYKGRQIDAQTVGRELGVSAVLTGKVVQRGDVLTVSAELVDARDNRLLWGRQYNRKVSDFFAIQEEISRQISDTLRLQVSAEDQKRLSKRQTESTEAYQAYLIGRYYWNKRTMEGFEKAIANFNQAIEKDKNFAHAYVGLADSYILIGYFGGLPVTEAMPKAKQAAMDALNIDDSIAEAHASLANIRAWYEWDAEGAEIEFKKAIELNPNYPTAHHWYGLYLAAVKRFDEAVREMKTAQGLDPTSLIIHADLGYVYYFARQYDQAIEQCQKTLEMDPNFEIAHYEMGLALAGKGNYDEAIASFKKATRLDDKAQALAMIGYAYAKVGNRGEAENILRKMEDLAKRRFVDANKMVVIYTALGDKDRAFEWLEKDFEARSSSMFEIGVDPRIDDLRSDIRFKNLLQRVGLPQ